MSNRAIPIDADELRRLRESHAELLAALERIANSVAIGAESKQIHARMRAIFKEIENEARTAIAAAKKVTP